MTSLNFILVPKMTLTLYLGMSKHMGTGRMCNNDRFIITTRKFTFWTTPIAACIGVKYSCGSWQEKKIINKHVENMVVN